MSLPQDMIKVKALSMSLTSNLYGTTAMNITPIGTSYVEARVASQFPSEG